MNKLDKFQLTIIGSGKMMPTKERHPSCYLLEVGSRRILLDIGHTSLARLVDLGVDLNTISHVFVSHFHTDHFADFLPLAHARWVNKLAHPERTHFPLTVIGPKSLKDRFRKLREVFWVEPNEDDRVKFLEGPRTLRLEDIKLELFPVKHVQWYQSLGIKVTYLGKTLIYTGDIGSDHPRASLAAKVKGADLLIIEAGNLKLSPNHMTIEQVISLAKEAEVEQTLATHIAEANVKLTQGKLKGHRSIKIAKDLMKINLLK
jgi:ribonuclease Z